MNTASGTPQVQIGDSQLPRAVFADYRDLGTAAPSIATLRDPINTFAEHLAPLQLHT